MRNVRWLNCDVLPRARLLEQLWKRQRHPGIGQSTKFWLNQDFTRPPAYVRNLRVCFGDACYMYIMHAYARRYDELTIGTIL